MDCVFHRVRFEGENADLSFPMSSTEIHSVFLLAAFWCHPCHHLPSPIRAWWLCHRQYLCGSTSVPFAVLMLRPSPTLSCWNCAFPCHGLCSAQSEVCRGARSACSSKAKHKHTGVPRRGRAGSAELGGTWLRPPPVAALCFQRAPLWAGDVTKCSLTLRKARTLSWSWSDHFDLGPLWFEE